jgi:hypothetical protein
VGVKLKHDSPTHSTGDAAAQHSSPLRRCPHARGPERVDLVLLLHLKEDGRAISVPCIETCREWQCDTACAPPTPC